MADRLSALDASFLYLESDTTPMHVGSLALFQETPGVLDHERLVRLIRDRIVYAPRYRQVVREVPAGLAHPVWVDDPRFDVSYHVRRSALPAPGTVEQLYDLVARIMSRPLDRRHPLWEVYLVEGVEGRRFALLTKVHQSMIDGSAAVDIGEVILDMVAEITPAPQSRWRPAPAPSDAELLVGAVSDNLRHPIEALGRLHAGMSSAGRALGDMAATMASALRPPDHSPLRAQIGQQRRFTTVDLRLEELKTVRRTLGGTINDATLAIVAGGLRSWMLARGAVVAADTTVRTLVPVSVTVEDDSGPGATREVSSRVESFLVDLPVGEPDPVIRLQRITFEMSRHGETGRAIGAKALVELVGFSAPTLHALGARVGGTLSRRAYTLAVINVPGPQTPLFAGGARMLSDYPIIPISDEQAVAIGVTSYDGGIFFGLVADRDAVPDLDLLATSMREALSELLEATRSRSSGRLRVAPTRIG